MASFDTLTELRTPDRDGDEFSTSWRVLHAGGQVEWDNMDCVWFVNGKQYASHYGQATVTNDTLAILNRSAWYPATGTRLSTVYAKVRGTMNAAYDGLENRHWGRFVTSPTLTLRAPYAPSVDLTINTGGTADEVEVTVSNAEEDAAHERHDTQLTVVRESNFGNTKKTTLYSVTSASGSDIEWSANVSTVEAGMAEGQWVKVTAAAKSRGYAGDSTSVAKSHVFAWPGRPQITKISLAGNSTTGKVMASVKTNQTAYRPVDSVQLQRLKSSTATTPSEAALAQGWTDVQYAVDDGDCTGLTDTQADAWPDRATRTWYRLKAVHDSHVLYSAPVDMGVYEPPATGGDTAIIAAVSCDDGTSIAVDVGWQADEATATQVSWGASATSWESTTEPSYYLFTWQDAIAQTGYSGSARVYVTDLEEGETVYVRARRVVQGETDVYGAWSDTVPVTPVSAPSWVSLSAPAVIARGSSLPLTWTFGSDAAQRAWRVTDSAGKVWASGDDADGATSIPAERLEDETSLSLMVSVTTGGDWKSSDYTAVAIADPPSCTVAADASITALPVTLDVTSDTADVSMTFRVESDGISYERPDGTKVQYSGEVVAAWTVTPAWSAATSGYEATVTMPDAALVNGCGYTVAAVSTDPSTGLKSADATDSFAIAWAHTATAPTGTVTPDSENLSASTIATAPSGAAQTDVCDVYRVTPDGAQLIASGVEFGASVNDRFAPFSIKGSCAYRVATRTAEGDVAWTDATYTLNHGGLRLDWGTRHVDLPYNVGDDESFAKDFEARKHMDGVTEGFWAAGTTRRASLSTDLIRLDSEEQRELLRDMARHPGAVFVRVGNGVAFEADVQLSKMTERHNAGAVAVSLECTGIALTDEHMCGAGDVTTTTTTTTGA